MPDGDCTGPRWKKGRGFWRGRGDYDENAFGDFRRAGMGRRAMDYRGMSGQGYGQGRGYGRGRGQGNGQGRGRGRKGGRW